MEVGEFQLGWGGSTEIVTGGRFSLPIHFPFGFVFVFLFSWYLLCYTLFSGLGLLKKASAMREEAHRLEVAAQEVEMKGLEKVEAAMAGLEVEGLWASEGGWCHTPHIFSPTSPRKLTISCPPLSPIHPPGVYRMRSLWSCRTGNGGCLSSCPSSFRRGNPCQHATPLHSVGGIKQVYRCLVEGCKEGPSTSCVTICAHVCKVHLEVILVCPSCSKSFFNPDTFWCHKKVILILNRSIVLAWGMVITIGREYLLVISSLCI